MKRRERSNCDCILLFREIVKYVTLCSVFVLYEIMMENEKKTKKTHFFWGRGGGGGQIGIFLFNWEKNILFGIGNGAEFWPQNQVMSPSPLAEKVLL